MRGEICVGSATFLSCVAHPPLCLTMFGNLPSSQVGSLAAAHLHARKFAFVLSQTRFNGLHLISADPTGWPDQHLNRATEYRNGE